MSKFTFSYSLPQPYVVPDDTGGGVDYDSAESLSSEDEESDDEFSSKALRSR